MRTLTAYLIGVAIVLAIVNGVGWSIDGGPRWHKFAIFSVGFLFGAIGMYLAAHLYGYRRAP